MLSQDIDFGDEVGLWIYIKQVASIHSLPKNKRFFVHTARHLFYLKLVPFEFNTWKPFYFTSNGSFFEFEDILCVFMCDEITVFNIRPFPSMFIPGYVNCTAFINRSSGSAKLKRSAKH